MQRCALTLELHVAPSQQAPSAHTDLPCTYLARVQLTVATALSAATAAAGPALMASKGALLLELRSPPAHLLSLIGAAHLPSQVTAQTRRHWCRCRRVNLCGQHACIPLPFVRCAQGGRAAASRALLVGLPRLRAVLPHAGVPGKPGAAWGAQRPVGLWTPVTLGTAERFWACW